jgi:hypothetical protein
MRPADTVRAHHRLRGPPRALAALVVLVGAAVLVAGCGGGSSLGVASISGSSTSGRRSSSSRPSASGVRSFGGAPTPAERAQEQVTGLVFSRCMRAHGVPDFPDPPSASGGGFGFVFGSGGLDPNAPLFRRAERTCSSVFSRRVAVAR